MAGIFSCIFFLTEILFPGVCAISLFLVCLLPCCLANYDLLIMVFVCVKNVNSCFCRRVASELNVKLGEEVGYAIRFEDRTSDKTRIK